MNLYIKLKQNIKNIKEQINVCILILFVFSYDLNYNDADKLINDIIYFYNLTNNNANENIFLHNTMMKHNIELWNDLYEKFRKYIIMHFNDEKTKIFKFEEKTKII